MTVSQTPELCLARVLPTPVLNYGDGSERKQIKPADGSWNLADQKFFKPAEVTGWAVVVYDAKTIREPDVYDIIQRFTAQADLLAKTNLAQESGGLTQILRYRIRQCLNGFKAKGGDPQYFANVCLKVNAKLGGINSILDPQAQKFLSDPTNPVMIIGASIKHPAPGASGRPSFASVAGSIDSTASHYSAATAAQDSRVEMVVEVEDLVHELIGRHIYWKKEQEKEQNVAPKRIIYYRAGVSEGQFRHVLDFELPGIKGAIRPFKLFSRVNGTTYDSFRRTGRPTGVVTARQAQ
ncbi:hypothetical protein FRC10_008467 [Ceratobasidium sp. 414]|nr:hypothetical protein FRC10_008467 [Ceratobasidium sp. 414]